MVITGIHFAPQVVDVDVHHIRHRIEIELPHLLHNSRPRDRLSRVPHQELQQRKLLRAKLNVVPVTSYGVIHAIQRQIGHCKDGIGRPVSATRCRIAVRMSWAGP